MAKKSYSNIVELILKIVLEGVNLKDNDEAFEFLKDFRWNSLELFDIQDRILEKDRHFTVALLNLLRRLKGPVSIGLLEKLTFCYANALFKQ